MKIEELTVQAKKIGIEITPDMCDALTIYMELLIERNREFNLTAITDPEEITEKHFYDSLYPLSVTDFHGRVEDVGSGAGFPGIVLALVRKDLDVILIEPTGKRCRFLEEVRDRLQLRNVTVVNQRAEEYVREHREQADIVTARAVAALPVLAELCVPLLKPGGTFVSMKGSKGYEELNEAGHALQILGCAPGQIHEYELPSGDKRTIITTGKEHITPGKYPRNYGQIRKRPL